MITYDAHGGHCCGITNIYGFSGYADLASCREALIRTLLQVLNENFACDSLDCDCGRPRSFKSLEGLTFNHLFEIVLTDYQMNNISGPAAKTVGFEVVRRFYNSNSGNWCNVMHYETAPVEE